MIMKPILVTLSLFLSVPAASAAVLITLSDGGPGTTHATITGSFNLTGGSTANGGAAATDRASFSDNSSHSRFDMARRTTPATTSESVTLRANPANPDHFFSESSIDTIPSGLTIDDFGLNGGGGTYEPTLFSFDGTNVGETFLNESLIFATDFSNFTPGTWEWGGSFGQTDSGTAPLNAMTLHIVPEPTTGGLTLFAILAGLCRRRR